MILCLEGEGTACTLSPKVLLVDLAAHALRSRSLTALRTNRDERIDASQFGP
jgi:hypothetical protein